MRVVFDTALITSLALSPSPRLAYFTQHLLHGCFEVITSRAILDECRAVLLHPPVAKKHGLTPDAVETLLLPFYQPLVVSYSPVPFARDPQAEQVFSCALPSGADYIVSDDEAVHLAPASYGVPVIDPKLFYVLLKRGHDCNIPIPYPAPGHHPRPSNPGSRLPN